MISDRKKIRVRRVTEALLGFRPGDRVVFVNNGAPLLGIESRLRKHGVLVEKDTYSWVVKFDNAIGTLYVREKNLIHEDST